MLYLIEGKGIILFIHSVYNRGSSADGTLTQCMSFLTMGALDIGFTHLCFRPGLYAPCRWWIGLRVSVILGAMLDIFIESGQVLGERPDKV